MKTVAFLAVAAVLSSARAIAADHPVVVHEWGTFTCLQDERGQAIGGINVDDESVPSFVYDLGYVHNQRGTEARIDNFGLPPYYAIKGWRPADHDVTMRLETPVLYFYPPKGDAGSTALPLKVHVDFHGGLLSQYYPYAETSGFPSDLGDILKFQIATCTSGLTWTVAHFGSALKPVETADKVWTTPREVSAPEIEVKAKVVDGGQWVDAAQAEHFLFYRGVGHLDSPLHLPSTKGTPSSYYGAYSLEPVYPDKFKSTGWLVEILPDGRCAFSDVGSFEIGEKSAMLLRSFLDSSAAPSFTAANLAKLKASMQDALVKAGLYPDEASAMLRTWELSYFKSPGLRFFYIVPRKWVDQVLPLKITGAPVEITRVMVGRIELISDEQKAALARLESEPPPDLNTLKQAADDAITKGNYTKQQQEEFRTGARPLTELGITLSPSVRDYLSLGRFRDALMVYEQQQHPTDARAKFLRENGLADR